MLSPGEKAELAVRARFLSERGPGGQDPESLSALQWIDVLDNGLESVSQSADSGLKLPPGVLKAGEPLPFEDVLAGLTIEPARSLEQLMAPDGAALLTQSARAALQRHLLESLCELVSPVLQIEFSAYRPQRHANAPEPAGPPAESERRFYDGFIDYLAGGGLKTFFLEYGVLGRLTATAIESWVASQTAFLTRLASDQAEIEASFNGGTPIGVVAEVRPGLSDRHAGGQTVASLRFSSGLQLVYKPRDSGLEEAFFQLLESLNRLGFPLQQKAPAILNRSTHSWIEAVTADSCSTRAEISRYYQRAGMLQCLLYLLQATDCHMDNVVASGEHPVLVDAETLMRPAVGDQAESASGEALETGFDEILQSSFLLSPAPGPKGARGDLSALAGTGGQPTGFAGPQWSAVNTDAMSMSVRAVCTVPAANLPLLGGEAVGPSEFLNDFSEGYRRAFEFALEHRQLLLGGDSPLAALKGKAARLVLRATRDYRRVLAGEPDLLRDGAEWSGRLAGALSAGATDRAGELPRAVTRAEQAALRDLDIPRFQMRTDSRELILPDGSAIGGFAEEDGYGRCRRRIRELTPEDLQRHLSLFKVLWAMRAVSPPSP